MEDTNKSRNDQVGNNKMIIKIGGGAGGGFGAIVLLGGALATAAFASAFVLVGQKRWSSHRRNSSPEKSEKDDERKGAKEEVEMEKDSTTMILAHSLKEDDEKRSDVEKTEDDAVSDDGFVVVNEEIPLLAEKEEKENAQLTKEDVSSDFSKESKNLDTKDKSAERESDGDGEIDEMQQPSEEGNNQLCHDQEDDVEASRAYNGVEGFQIDQTNDDKNVNMEKSEFCNGNGEINEEKFVESEAIDRAKVELNDDGKVVSEIHNIDGEEPLLPHAVVEMVRVDESMNGCVVNLSTKQNGANEEIGERLEVDAKIEGLETVKYGENEEDPGLGLNENGAALVQHPDSETQGYKDDVEKEIENDNGGKATMSNMENGEVSEGADVIKKTSVANTDDGVDRSKDLKEALWQETQQVKVMSYEVGGKIEEDMVVMKKYDEVEMGMVKNHRKTNSTRRRMIVWMLCVVSSLSCSWFFDMTCAKMCLVVFLTVFLLEIYGYPLMNRQQDRCLHAVKGEVARGY